MSEQSPVSIIHRKGVTAPVKGEPALLVSTTSSFKFITDDRGSGASMDLTIYRPAPVEGRFIVGDYAQGNYNPAEGAALIIWAVNEDPNYPILKAPTGFTQIWNDRGSGARLDTVIWRPVAPDGYITLGCVATAENKQPEIALYRCIRQDYVEDTGVGNLIWNDRKSGAHASVSLWQLEGVRGAFVAQANYDPYIGQADKVAGK